MPVSPQLDSSGYVNLTVLCNGKKVGDEVRFHHVEVRRAIGKVPTALLVVDDGDMADGTWAVADADTFKPGTKITIRAGYDSEVAEHAPSDAVIFGGVVVRLGVRIDGSNFSRLHVHCKDEAVKMTVGRRNVNFIDKTDSEIIAKLISDHGLSKDVDDTTTQYGELVQYYCSDWDFMMSRAEVNGLLVIADDGTLRVKSPATDSEAELKVEWGLDLIEFNADVDAPSQLTQVTAVAWDPKTQAVVESTATPETLNAQGNLKSAELATVVGLDTFTLQSATTLEQPSLKAWAKAQQIRAGLARIRGRMKFQGSAKAKVGSLIDVIGVGERFDGSVFVGGLEHDIVAGNWFTEVEFGLPETWFSAQTDIVAPPAAGWLPGAEGLQVGVVLKLDGDPKGEQRVQVRVPVLKAETDGVWARLMQYYASKDFGAFYLPELGDEVVLGYFNGDPSNPVVLGSLYSSNRAPPYALEAENYTKALVTRSKARIEIDDKDVVITIKTPAENKIVISDKDKSILLSDENGNTVKLHPSGIDLDSPGDIKLTAKGSISLDASNAISLTAKADVTAKGLNVTADAQVAFTGKGAAKAELSASGQVTVRGAMVMIN